MTEARPQVVVVGGGIAGLAAALHAQSLGAAVTIAEADDRVGGKLRTERFAGRLVDCGADAFLTRRPEAVRLAHAVGLGDDLVAPATGRAHLAFDGRLHPLPTGLVMGVPSDLRAVAASRVLQPAALARLAADVVLPGALALGDGDEAVGALLRRRLGDEAFELLVDPLLSGINAGDADQLSLQAGVPQLAALLGGHRSALLAARGSRGTARSRALTWVRRRAGRLPAEAPPASPFLTPRAGMERLATKASRAFLAGGGEALLRWRASSIEPGATGGYRVRSGPTAFLDADAVVVALPPKPAAALLEPLAPLAASTLDGFGSASVALVALAYPASAFGRVLDGSGMLVPRRHPGILTACSWWSNKWPHTTPAGADGDLVVVRASAGRAGDQRALALSDGDLVARLHAELVPFLQLLGPPAASRVTRWIDGFPQYAPGHLDVVRELHASLPRGLAVAGAAYQGVGVPACIASGQRAADAALR